MKNIKYLLLLFLGFTVMYACDEDDSEVYNISGGDNIAIFEQSKTALTRIADGAEHIIDVKMKLQGPSLDNVSGDVTVTISADASSTAIEGVHYRIDESSFKLVPGQRYIGLYSGITMLTEGIDTPLDKSPVLVLKVASTTGGGNVIASGKTLPITLNYACPSDLAGDYTATVLRDGAVITPYSSVTVVMTDVGTYRASEVGHWSSFGNVPGFTFTDVCGVISVPQQNLVETYSNQVQSFKPGSVDEATGTLRIIYKISSDDWESEYDVTLVPVD